MILEVEYFYMHFNFYIGKLFSNNDIETKDFRMIYFLIFRALFGVVVLGYGILLEIFPLVPHIASSLILEAV